jgi:hypothetical protein
MSLTIVSASNPKYTSADGLSIDLTVKFKEFLEPLQFHAVSTDYEPHGVDLYNRAKAGEFGEVAAYVPPPQPKTVGVKTA